MTIVPRNNAWGVKTWDPGARKYRWQGTYATEAEAVQAERDAKLRPGRDIPTIEQWARIWLSDYTRPAPATQRSYRYSADRISREVGKLKLDDLSRPEARKLANRWPRAVTRVARTMWADAARDGIVEVNPWTNLRLETPRGRKDLDALTEREILELGDTAATVHEEYGSEARAIILTLGFTGVRPGELCALRRDDLDVTTRELTVRFSLDATGVEKCPKNGKPRTVTVPPPALRAILDMPQRIGLAAGADYLFRTKTGKRLSKGTLHYMWRPVLSAWVERGGRDMDLYSLRHACATLFLERGMTPGDVATQLGHGDGGRLIQVLYGHPDQGHARDRLRMAFDNDLASQHAIMGTQSKRPGDARTSRGVA